MDTEGYPVKKELNKIKKWDCKDVFSLIDYIEEMWQYADWGFKKYWAKDEIQKKDWVLNIELHTAGWSGNEDVIDALLSNTMFKMMWYKEWRRGGHFYFEINPYNIGYKPVSELSKELKISRQRIHHATDKFEFIMAAKRISLARLKK